MLRCAVLPPCSGCHPFVFLLLLLLPSCVRCSDVTDLIKATPEADILRRDINDRPPIL